jgi:hypothetical protein
VKNGIYQFTEKQYHADPCPKPSLSSSIAGIIWHRTPLHGWMAHPKLNPQYEHTDSGTFDLGSAAHAVILEGNESKIAIIEADDWRTKAAKEARDEARAAGKIPMLPHQHAEVMAMATAAHEAIAGSELAGIFQDGNPEQTAIAHDGIWMRGRFDWLTTDRKIILDYKTVGRSASPESFLRSSVFSFGYDIQAAMYLHLNALTGGPEDAKFVWLVQETEAPYACSLCGASPSLIESGQRKLSSVIDQWTECMLTGVWLGYGKRIAWLEAPAWELAKVEERELQEYEE